MFLNRKSVFISWLFLNGCFAYDQTIQGVNDRVNTLETKLQQLEIKIDSLKKLIEEGELKAKEPLSSDPLEDYVKNLTQTVELLQRDVSIIKTKVLLSETPTSHTTSSLSQQDPHIQKLLEELKETGARNVAEAEAMIKVEKEAPTLPKGSVETQYDQIQVLYRQAKTTQKPEAYIPVLRAIEELRRVYPKNPFELNLKLLEGESYLANKQFTDAQKKFVDVYQVDKNGTKGLEALIRLVQCFMVEGAKDKAKVTIQTIRKEFGNYLDEDIKKQIKTWEIELKKTPTT